MRRGGAPRRLAPMSRSAAAKRLPLAEPDVRPTFRRERRALARGIWPVAGCDEAGRGPLAGPVVAAAVVLDPKRIPKGLDDSKKLDREEREALYLKICASAQVAVAFGSTARIERDNILRASLWALAQAERALPIAEMVTAAVAAVSVQDFRFPTAVLESRPSLS